MTSTIDRLRSCKYIYLDSITEPQDNKLRIVLLEAATGSELTVEQLEKYEESLRSILSRTNSIEHLKGCSKFELLWENYIGYSIVNESYSNGEPESSNGKGNLLVEYEYSVYLEYLSRASFATSEYPGPYKHWAIYCLNHTIDIASQVSPTVRIL
jgi:hypothetical protein